MNIMLPSSRTYGFWLALFRIYLGAFWLDHGLGKLRAQPAFGAPDGAMIQFVNSTLAKTSGPYHAFMASTVSQNVPVFATLVEFGEVTAGALLLLGLFTRLGGLLGAVLALNYWAAKGDYAGFSSFAGFDMLAVAASALHLALPTGRYLGLDGVVSRRRSVAPAPRPSPPSRPPPIVVPPGA
jgi:uncharacterized membrane protein YphA (DoxX/SURF4 family)